MTAFEKKGGVIYSKGREVIVETRQELEKRITSKQDIEILKTASIIGLCVGFLTLIVMGLIK
jgi:hypothetical protein